MDPVERNLTDPWHQLLQTPDITGKATFVLVFEDKFCSGLLKGPYWPHPIDLCLPGLLRQPREVALCLFEFRRASALANSPSADAFVDVPDTGPLDEARRSFASHN